jgi:hypothetical protein
MARCGRAIVHCTPTVVENFLRQSPVTNFTNASSRPRRLDRDPAIAGRRSVQAGAGAVRRGQSHWRYWDGREMHAQPASS